MICCIIQRHLKRELYLFTFSIYAVKNEWTLKITTLLGERSELFQELVNDLLPEPVRLEVHMISFHYQPVEHTVILELAKSNPAILI